MSLPRDPGLRCKVADIRDLIPQAQKPGYTIPQALWRGTIAKAPDNQAGQVFVIIPDIDADQEWGPCMWQPRDSSSVPTVGDPCLVAFDNRRVAWIVSYWSGDVRGVGVLDITSDDETVTIVETDGVYDLSAEGGGGGIPPTDFTAKGDMLVGTGSGTHDTKAVGADNELPVADSAQADGIRWDKVGNAMVASGAAIAYSKLNLAGSIVNADIASGAAIVYAKLSLAASIVNADVATGAAIAKNKLAALDILNSDVDVSAAIAYTKLNLGASVTNSDIATAAAIAYSKLNLSGSILNADIASAAAIAISKLASYPSDSTKALFGDGTWKVPTASGPLITVSAYSSGPPSSPASGDIWVATGAVTGVSWTFCYNSALATYKWSWIGGPPITIRDFSGLSRSNTVDNTWEMLPGFGTITLARSGYYHWWYGSNMAGQGSVVQYFGIGSTTPGSGIVDPILFDNNNAGTIQVASASEVDDLAAGGALRSSGTSWGLQIQSSSHTLSWLYFSHLSVVPIQII